MCSRRGYALVGFADFFPRLETGMVMKRQVIGSALFSGMLAWPTTGFAQSGSVVKYHASMEDVKYVYGVA